MPFFMPQSEIHAEAGAGPPALDGLTFLVGAASGLAPARPTPPRPPFDGEVLAFLEAFGRRLMNRPEARPWPDVITLGYWCRRASLERMKAGYPDLADRLGRGLAFHVAPANVAVNFAYSLAAGLLAGNVNVVRAPSRDFPQVEMITRALNETLAEHGSLRPYVFVVRYGHQAEINETLSALCDARIIWGGDAAVSALRRCPLPPRAVELTFADRYSLAVIDADRCLEMEDAAGLAAHFYNDTLLTDQLACTAPALVVWLGRAVGRAREKFWAAFETLAVQRYNLQPALAVARLTAFCALCAEYEGVSRVSAPDSLVFRAQVPSLAEGMLAERPGGGFFLEYEAGSLDEILPICGRRCQTLAALGLSAETLRDFLDRHRPPGIDRVTPLGRTLDFTLQWDGHDLIYALTRRLLLPRPMGDALKRG